MPVLLSMGMSPIQFGAALILNRGIGRITPPVGACLWDAGLLCMSGTKGELYRQKRAFSGESLKMLFFAKRICLQHPAIGLTP